MGPCIAAVHGSNFAFDHGLGRIQLHEFGLTRESHGEIFDKTGIGHFAQCYRSLVQKPALCPALTRPGNFFAIGIKHIHPHGILKTRQNIISPLARTQAAFDTTIV